MKRANLQPYKVSNSLYCENCIGDSKARRTRIERTYSTVLCNGCSGMFRQTYSDMAIQSLVHTIRNKKDWDNINILPPLEKEYRTGNVNDLIYDVFKKMDRSRLPVLADMLEDAGYEGDYLTNLRNDNIYTKISLYSLFRAFTNSYFAYQNVYFWTYQYEYMLDVCDLLVCHQLMPYQQSVVETFMSQYGEN